MSKRTGARVMVHRRVEYQHARGKGAGTLVDLSLQGCRITGASPGPCGTRLRLQLWMPDQSEPVKVELAAVRWVTDDQFAVSFLEVSPEARACLAQVVQVPQTAQQAEAHRIHISAFVGSAHSEQGGRASAEALGSPPRTSECATKIMVVGRGSVLLTRLPIPEGVVKWE